MAARVLRTRPFMAPMYKVQTLVCDKLHNVVVTFSPNYRQPSLFLPDTRHAAAPRNSTSPSCATHFPHS